MTGQSVEKAQREGYGRNPEWTREWREWLFYLLEYIVVTAQLKGCRSGALLAAEVIAAIQMGWVPC